MLLGQRTTIRKVCRKKKASKNAKTPTGTTANTVVNIPNVLLLSAEWDLLSRVLSFYPKPSQTDQWGPPQKEPLNLWTIIWIHWLSRGSLHISKTLYRLPIETSVRQSSTGKPVAHFGCQHPLYKYPTWRRNPGLLEVVKHKRRIRTSYRRRYKVNNFDTKMKQLLLQQWTLCTEKKNGNGDTYGPLICEHIQGWPWETNSCQHGQSADYMVEIYRWCICNLATRRRTLDHLSGWE